MMKSKTLAHPPIKEAVLEVLLDYPETVTMKFLNEYGRLIASRFPNKENIVTFDANLVENNDKITRNIIGHVFFSGDKKTTIQTRVNGFAFAQTGESYTSWDVFKPLAFKELQAFIEFTAPVGIKRFSLRFINEIKIPPTDDLKEYLVFLPNVDTLNLPIRNFVCRMELDKADIGALAIVSQLFSPPFEPTVNVYLDIDVVINESELREVDLKYLSDRFDSLREFKNDIFFSTLTEKTVNLYN